LSTLSNDSVVITDAAPVARRLSVWQKLARNTSVMAGAAVLALILLLGLVAPLLGTVDPSQINPSNRNQLPGTEISTRLDDGTKVSHTAWMGTDSLGRDIYSRVLYGVRVSVIVGVSVSVISIFIGLLIGLVSGYVRWLDGIVMRVMDGLMAIPAILLAIALVSIWSSGSGLMTVILAIVVPEVPRVVRLVRALVLSIREEPYVEAAIAAGTRLPRILAFHILPNTVAPLIVQATYICASAILIEAILSFLGIGIPTTTPTWGNIMAEGRGLIQLFPHNLLFPGIFLALTVLAVNIMGDGLRDTLDPKMAKRTG